MEWNDLRDEVGTNVGVYDNPADLSAQSWTVMRFAEYENPNGSFEWLIRKDGCMHCEDPGCLKAALARGAIVQYTNGIVDFHEENCIGCGYCITGCPFNIPRLSKTDHKAYKAHAVLRPRRRGAGAGLRQDLPDRRHRVRHQEAMKDHAAERIEDLKSRGFDKAGLYDPAGVGGTHVMYVLHHADQPSLYHGLPDQPRISPLVGLWKGVAKPLAVAGMVLTALAGFFHYIRVGPNETGPEDEEAAGRAWRAANRGRSKTGRTTMKPADKPGLIVRYTAGERTTHWIVAIAFVLLALSGLALFHPSMFWLSNLFGGGTGRASCIRSSASSWCWPSPCWRCACGATTC